MPACTPQNASVGSAPVLELEPGQTFIAVGRNLDREQSTELLQNFPSAALTVGTATDGPTPVSRSDSRTFIPASITKIVTTALALKTLGAGFRFKTRISWLPESGGRTARDLTIVANGDPQAARTADENAERARLVEIANRLYASGVRRLVGSVNLVSADERKDHAAPPIGSTDDDNSACYGAVAQAFNYRWNCGTFEIRDLDTITWTDSNLEFPLRVSLSRTTGSSSVSTTPEFSSAGHVESFLIQGALNPRARAISVSVPIAGAKHWYGNALLAAMSRQGIDVSDATPAMPTGAAARAAVASVSGGESFEVQSDPVRDLIRYTNKASDNFLADSLFKEIASRDPSRASDLRVAGGAAMERAVTGWLQAAGEGELAREVHLIDGAGLSRQNRVSARGYLALLRQLTREPGFADLWASLPIAGRDGTLRSRMRGTSAEGRVRAKTGTLTGSYQLAGYVPRYDRSGNEVEYVPFVILTAGEPSERSEVFELQARIASRLYDVVNGSSDAGR